MNNQQRSDYLLYTAVQEQNFEQVQQMWTQYAPQSFKKEILIRAIEGRCDEIFHFVVDRLEQKYIDRAIANAIYYEERFDYLLPRADLKFDHSLALSCAVNAGNTHMVKRLIPLSNPKDPECTALYDALFEENMEMAQVLYPVSNIESTMQQLVDSGYECEKGIEWLQSKINEEQNTKLHSEIGTTNAPVRGRKI